MSEHHIGYRIRHHLNQDGVLDARISTRLAAAREYALARQRTAIPAPMYVWLDSVLGRLGPADLIFPRLLLPMLVLIFGLISIQSWRQTQLAEEIEEIDAAVLTGELPIDAYMDMGFDAWLKRSSQ